MTKSAPPSHREAGEGDAVEDPGRLLTDLLLGRAGAGAGLGQRQIRVASGMVLGGVCLGLAGFACIALAQMRLDPYPLRELGGLLGGAGLLVLMWGILTGLPAGRAARAIGVTGVAAGLLGMAAFAWAYPEQWGRIGVVDQTVPVLATYVAGLVMLVAATFGALVADFVLRMQTRARLRDELGREPTDEEIQRDIDEAMRKHKVTWGGVVEDTTRGIKVKVEALPPGWTVSMPRIGREVEAKRESVNAVDVAVDNLVKFRGGRVRTDELPEGGLGDAAGALQSLKVARETAPKLTWWQRLFAKKKPSWSPPPGWDGAPGAQAPGGPPLPPRHR